MPRKFNPLRKVPAYVPVDTGIFSQAAAAVSAGLSTSEILRLGIEDIALSLSQPPVPLAIDATAPGNRTVESIMRSCVRPPVGTQRLDQTTPATVVARYQTARVVRSKSYAGVYNVEVGATRISALSEKPDDALLALLVQAFEAGVRRGLECHRRHAVRVTECMQALVEASGAAQSEEV